MTTITDIRTQGTDLTVVSTPIYEPIGAPTTLTKSLQRFGEDYDLSTGSNLYKFLLALCGDAGAGQIKKQMLYPRLQSMLSATQFTDLDKIYGTPLGLARNTDELYTSDPRNDALTQDEWTDVQIKDAHYRARCLTWMRAIIAGPTPDGIKLAAEAAIGVECDVWEQYKYLENQNSDSVAPMANWGVTNNIREFVVLPLTPQISIADRRRIIRLIDRIKPANTICTIQINDSTRVPQIIQSVAASSEGFNVKRLVTGRLDINWPPVNPSKGFWITTQEEEAPTFAFMDPQETVTYFTVINATASSEHMGQFNKTQRNLFGNLNYSVDAFKVFSANQSYQKVFAPIQLTVPWTAST